MINYERLLNRFLEYVQIDSETLNEKEMGLKVKKDLEELGFTVEFDNVGEIIGGNCGNLIAKLEGDNSLEPLLFSGHLDTVKVGNGIKPIIEDGIIKSSGNTILGGDDKCAIASIVEAMCCLKENNINHPPIEIVFTVCEEGGLNGSKHLNYSKISSKRAIIIDSSGAPGKIVMSAPGQMKYHITFNGKSAHAGISPESGISAIQVAAEAITNIKLLRVDSETTSNIGTFKSEFATNIVPDKAVIIGEIRSLNNSKLLSLSEEIMTAIENACKKYSATFSGGMEHSYDGYVHSPEDDLIKLIIEKCESISLEHGFMASGGGSDTNNFITHGIKAVNLACGMTKVHSNNEELAVKDLNSIANLVLALATA